MTDTKHTCCEKVRRGDTYRWSICGKTAKVERDGKHYCGTHDPVAKDAKRKASQDKFRAEFDADRARRDAQVQQAAEHARRSACFDDLLAALQAYEDARDTMFSQCCSNPVRDAWGREVSMAKFNHASLIAGKAIKKATNTTQSLPRQL